MIKKKFALTSIVIFLFILISFYFDSEIVLLISNIRSLFLNEFFLSITFLSSNLILFFVLTFLFLGYKSKRRWILPLWVTLFSSAVVSFILKFSIQRLRPFQLGLVEIPKVLEKSSHLIWNFSFPSFQSLLVFCAIPIISKEFPKIKYFWILFAVLVSFSRVYFGLHFLSDVIFGGALGYLIGIIIIDLEKRYGFGKDIYQKIFLR